MKRTITIFNIVYQAFAYLLQLFKQKALKKLYFFLSADLIYPNIPSNIGLQEKVLCIQPLTLIYKSIENNKKFGVFAY